MPRHDNVTGLGTAPLVDQDPVFGAQVRKHGLPLDFQELTTATKKQQQILKTCCCKRREQVVPIQEAVTQASLRPLDCQNMPWTFSTAAISSSALAWSMLTLQALQSLAAFQKVSCRSGKVARCSGLK